MNWKETNINVGNIPEMGKVRVVFNATDETPEIDRIVAGCRSCTSVKFLKDKKELHVGITFGQIPVHLRHQKSQGFKKVVTVYYKNGNLDVLEITGNKTIK